MAMNGSSITPHDKEVLNQIFSQGLPYEDEESGEDVNHNEIVENELVNQVKAIEAQAVHASESGDYATSLELLNQAVALVPERASIYNNRAQVFRLKGDIEGALADLDRAIELTSGSGPVACQAFTQRGLIKIRNGDNEAAKADLGKAGDLGSSFAKQVVAAMNPYAAMCNQMLGELMCKLRNGEGDES